MARNQVTLTFAGDTSSLERAFGRAGQAGSKLGGALKKIGTAGAVAGFVALGAAAKVGWDEFMQGEKVTAQTRAALKSTGGAAHVTAAQIDALGTSLMRKSGIDDEAIKSGANLLLTFTSVRNEVGKGNDIFNQATKAALDLSVAFGKDMASSSILVGKALNDPIKGISALTRVGVSFTQAQKDSIKAMVAMGNTAGAQKLILAELTRETGGSAAALGKTLPGQISLAKEEFSNLAGAVVGKLVPALLSVVDWVRAHWPQISAVFQVVKTAVVKAVDDAMVWIKANVVPTLASVTATAKALWESWGPTVTKAMSDVKAALGPALAVVTSTVNAAMALLRGDWVTTWDGLKGTVVNAYKAIAAVMNAQNAVFEAIARKGGLAIWAGIKAGLAALAGLASHIVSLIGAGISTAAAWALTTARGIGRSIVTGIWDGISGASGWLAGKIRDFVTGGITGIIKSILHIGSPSKVMAEQVGRPIVEGIAAGVWASAKTLTTAIDGVLNDAVTKGGKGGKKASAGLLEKLGLMAPGQTSKGTLAKAYADLTPGLWDDLRALKQLANEAQDAFAAAARSGIGIADASSALVQARSNLAALGPMQVLPGGGLSGLNQGTVSLGPNASAASNGALGGGAGGGGGGSTINIFLSALDPQAASSAVIQAINDYERRNGPVFARAAA